jgi:excisionase family DNA binding protein
MKGLAASVADLHHISLNLRIHDDQSDTDKDVAIPSSLIRHIEFILTTMAQGKGIEMITLEDKLSTQQAADMLGVSRPFVVKLLEEGQIPFEKVGTHRRIQLSDLKAYEQKQEAIRSQQLDFLARQAQDLNLGY